MVEGRQGYLKVFKWLTLMDLHVVRELRNENFEIRNEKHNKESFALFKQN